MEYTLTLTTNQKLETRILDALRVRFDKSNTTIAKAHANWRSAEDSFMLYVPKTETDLIRESRRDSGIPQYTTISVPYSYGMLLTAYTYWVGVFLERSPIFQFTSRGEAKPASTKVLNVEALIDYQVNQGLNLPQMHAWLLDVGKYGIGIMEECWESELKWVSSWLEEVNPETGKPRRVLVSDPIPGYKGNKLYNVRPYDFFPDPRFPLMRYQDGEFVVTYMEQGIWSIEQAEQEGFYFNVKALKENGPVLRSFGENGSSAMIRPDSSHQSYSYDEMTDSAAHGLLKHTIKIIPERWGLSKSKNLEKWVFVTSADHGTLVSARPLGLLHDRFPVTIGLCEPDAYSMVARGLFDVLKGVQQTMDWLVNSRYFNVRATLNSSIIFDPSRITTEDLTKPAVPEKKYIRIRPAAYGTDPRTTFAQLNIPDVTQSNIGDINVMHEMGQRATGISDALMGMQETGGRRSATEFRTTAAGASSRLKSTSELLSSFAMAPLATRLLQNSQQYYEGVETFKIVGSSPQALSGTVIEVTPESISGQFDFVPVDGTLPIDRMAQAQAFNEFIAKVGQFPDVVSTYDIAAMAAYGARLIGMKEIDQFKLDPVQQMQKKMEIMEPEAPPGAPPGMAPAPAMPQNGAPM